MSTLEAKLEVLNKGKEEPFFRDMLWVTKTGETIPFRDLKDDHLQNIIAFIERMRNEILQTLGACDEATEIVCCSPGRSSFVVHRVRRSAAFARARCENQLLCLRQEVDYRSKL